MRKRAIKCFCSCPSSGWRPARSGRFSRGSAGIWRSRRLCRARYSAHTDAVRSCRDLARRREILKDSRVGSFAVIGVVLLALCQTALFASAKAAASLWTLVLLPAVSRCGSALAVTALRPMSTSQYAAQKKPKSHIIVLCAQLAVYLAAGFLAGWRTGAALCGCLAGYALALRKAFRSLDGMNGDISGYALTLSELCGAAVWALI